MRHQQKIKSHLLITILAISLITSCKQSTKFSHCIEPLKKDLVLNNKKFSESTDNEKLIGCWISSTQKMLPNGKTLGERQLESTELLIFFKDNTFASATVVGSSLLGSDNPTYYYMYNYSVKNGNITYKNSDSTETTKPIKIDENSIEFWDNIFTKGNCSE